MNGEKVVGGVDRPEVEAAGMPTEMERQLDASKIIGRIQAIAQVIDGCVKASLVRTSPQDWVRMYGKNPDGSRKESFYLQASGIEKIRPVWGIYYRERKTWKEIKENKAYTYICFGVIGSKVLDGLYGENTLEIEGARSSDDPFFIKGDREPDEADIRKAAYANFQVRAVGSLLGLKNMNANDLTRLGIDINAIPAVEWKKGSEGGGATNLISEAQRKRLYAISKDVGVQNGEMKHFLKSEYGLDSSTDIPRDKYEEIVKKVQAGDMGKREPGMEG